MKYIIHCVQYHYKIIYRPLKSVRTCFVLGFVICIKKYLYVTYMEIFILLCNNKSYNNTIYIYTYITFHEFSSISNMCFKINSLSEI